MLRKIAINSIILVAFTSTYWYIVFIAFPRNGLTILSRKTQEIRYLIEPGKFGCNGSAEWPVFVKSEPTDFSVRRAIRETWMVEAGRFLTPKLRVIFTVGSVVDSEKRNWSNTVNKLLNFESRLYDDILQIDFVDSYASLVRKTYCTLQWFVGKCENNAESGVIVDFVIFADSDVLIFPRNLLAFLDESVDIRRNGIFGRCWNDSKPNRNSTSKVFTDKKTFSEDFYPTYCSGTSYIMTGEVPGKLLNILSKNTSLWTWLEKFKVEDVAFTGILRQLSGVKAIHSEQFTGEQEDICEKNIISLHSFRPASLYRKTWKNLAKKLYACERR